MSLKTRFQNLLGIETKSLASPEPWLFDLFGARSAASGISVTPRVAMTCAPFHCGVQAISEGIGQLPIHVYERGADGAKKRAPDHPVYKLLHDEANEWTPAAKFREELTRDAILFPSGAFAHIVFNDDGKPIQLIRIDQEVEPVTVQIGGDYEPVYSIPQKNGPARIIERQNIFHLPSPSLNGVVNDARETIGLSLIMERYAARLFSNGARPGSLIIAKDIKTPDGAKNAKTAFDDQFKGEGSGGNRVAYGVLCECQIKRRAEQERLRPTAHERGYGSKWQRESRIFLARPENRYCACGCGRIADCVDHIIPHRGNMKLFWDRKNWQALASSPCHSSRKQSLESGHETRT